MNSTGPITSHELVAALHGRPLSIDELCVARGITTARAFRTLREAINRGWVEALDRTGADGRPLRRFGLTAEGCVAVAPLLGPGPGDRQV